MANCIDLYRNSEYQGLTDIEMINRLLNTFEDRATKLLNYIDWDEIVIYAIYIYDTDSKVLIAADFMLVHMTYNKYFNLAGKISPNCKIFFKSNFC